MLYTRAYILNIGLNPSKRFPERRPITEQEIRLTLERVFGAWIPAANYRDQ